jgi:predicted dehydrogenase
MSHTKPLKVALLGCGAVSQLYYTPALRELEKIHLLQVKALFDPNPKNMVQLGQSFPTATQLQDLTQLSRLGIGLAIIASPPRYHAEQAIQALQSGLSVLCEKPMAMTVAEGEAMIQAAAAAQRVLAIGLFRRFFPATQTIRDVLSLGILGEVRSFSFSEGGRFNWPAQSPSFFQKATAQGGVLMDIGVHVLDLLLWWLGQPIDIRYEDDAMGGVEANCRLTLKFARGCAGEVRLSRDWLLSNRYVMQCTKGWLSWEANDADRIQMGFNNAGFCLNSQLHEERLEHALPTLGRQSANFQQSFINQLQNMVAAIQGTQQLVVPGEQGLQSLKLIEHCYHHRTLMPMPWLNEQERTRAWQLSNQSR